MWPKSRRGFCVYICSCWYWTVDSHANIFHNRTILVLHLMICLLLYIFTQQTLSSITQQQQSHKHSSTGMLLVLINHSSRMASNVENWDCTWRRHHHYTDHAIVVTNTNCDKPISFTIRGLGRKGKTSRHCLRGLNLRDQGSRVYYTTALTRVLLSEEGTRKRKGPRRE